MKQERERERGAEKSDVGWVLFLIKEKWGFGFVVAPCVWLKELSSVGLWIFCGGGCFVGLEVWSVWPWRPQDQWVKFGFGSLAVRLS